MRQLNTLGLVFLATCAGFCNAQIGIINTFAGSPNGIVPGDGSPANMVLVSNPAGLATDFLSGNVFIAASGNSLIRKVDPRTGIITTVAGGGTGGDGGLATNAQLTNPCDVKVDGSGNIYLAETCVIAEGGGGGGGGGPISRVRRVDATTGIITTVAGASTAAGFSGDGGPATQALLNMPIGLALDSAGNLYIADAGNNRVRRVDAFSGIITTFAGNGSATFAGDGGPATFASLNLPTGLAFDANGNLYIADLGNNRIRRVDIANGTISTIAGTGISLFDGDGVPAASAGLSSPASLTFNSSGQLIFSEVGDGRVRLIDSAGLIWTLAGPGDALGTLGDNGLASAATLSRPEGVAFSTLGILYISELTGGRVRSIAPPYSVATAVTVSAGGNNFAQSSPVTLTATLAAANGQPYPATGWVTIYDGSTAIYGGALANSVVSFTTSTLALGTHNLQAIYNGDGSYAGSYSPIFTLTITAPSSAVSLSVSPNPGVANQAVSLTATVTPSAATGSVTFFNGGAGIGSAMVNSGLAILNGVTFAAGNYSLTARYNGDSNYATVFSSAVSLVVKTASSATVASSLNPSITGQAVTFTATVTPATATGSVQFLDGAAVLTTMPLTSGSAAYTTSTLSQGTHSISVLYSGDANNSSVQSAAITQTINAPSATTTSLFSSLNPSTVGAQVYFSVAITPSSATGTVQFLDGGTVLGNATLVGGGAQFGTSTLTQGVHSITAVYSGDASNSTSTSSVLTQTVKQVPTVSLVSSLNPSVAGQSVTFTLTLNATATGTAQILDGATVIATVPVTSGSAVYSSTSLTQGTHPISAIYSGDSNFTSVQSGVVTQTVKASTTTTLLSPTNPSPVGSPVSLTANVVPSTATGSVQFLDGATVLGTATLSNGSAVFTATGLTQGTHPLTALYLGDAADAGSTSAVVSEAIKLNPGFFAINTSQNPSAVGQTVTFTIGINPAATGTVQIQDGSTTIATVTINAGSAAYSTSTLSLGAHTITAIYSGDATYVGVASSYFVQTVNAKATTTTGIASSQNPAYVNSPVTFTATISPSSATGTVQFLDGATVVGTANIASGSASLTTSTLAQGAHSITAVYSGDAANLTSTSAVLAETINAQVASIVGLVASQNPIPVGGPVTFTATVNPATATGTVQFLDGPTVLGTVTLRSGFAATLTTSSLTAGNHSITAVYSGDAGDSGSTSAVLSEGVRVVTAFTLASSLNPSVIGQSVTLAANITAAATGSVQFLDGGTVLATVPLSSGVATYSSSALAQGVHNITATYPGDGTYWNASAALTQTVNAKTAASVSLSSSPNPSPVGGAVTVTAVLSPTSATGTVQFLDGGTVIGTTSVASGAASFNTSSLARGVHSLTAVYSGDAVDTAATSGVLTQTVKASASVSLTSTPNPSSVGQSVSLTATVSPSSATGTVQFLDGGTVLSTVTLSSGNAVYSTSQLAAGAHSLSAVYSGDTSDTAATSAVITQTVNVVAPVAPSSLTASAAGSSQINLSWTASPTSGVTYDVYSSTTNGFTPGSTNRLATGISATTYSATGLTASKAYYFRVTAVNSAGESSPTNQATATTSAAVGCHVSYNVTTAWNTGFGGAFSIQNTGSAPLTSWTLTWSWPGNQKVTQSWNANYSQSGGNLTFTNMSYNGTIAAGATLSGMGFNASFNGGTPVTPPAFYVNGTLCQ